MAVTKDLGAVTAYAHAVEGGYTGTLAEFETLMASYATVAQQAAASASNAEAFGAGTRNGDPVSSGDAAYENNAVYYAGIAEDAKDDAEAAAASLVIEDEFDEDSTNALENGVITKALETKAEIDGAYESMTVGNAEQLVSTVSVNDEESYNFRTSGGSADIGDREYDTIVGGTVAWNQLAQNGNFALNTKWDGRYSTTTISDGIATSTVDSEGTQRGLIQSIGYGSPITAGHRYLIAGTVKAPINGAIDLSIGGGSGVKVSVLADTWTRVACIWTAPVALTDGRVALYFYQNLSQGAIIQYKDVMCIDLTAMFGSTIADYIYSLETATAGAGVAWFKKLFPKPYYEYNAGELMSVNVSAHNTVGFNAWDEEAESGGIYTSNGQNAVNADNYRSKNYIPILPNTGYYVKNSNHAVTGSKSIRLFFYDSDKNFIESPSGSASSRTFTTPQNAYYMRFIVAEAVANFDNTICINLSWDGERDGEYEEYVKHSYPLDSSLTLQGIPKLDANNRLYYDGDTYESNGNVARKYAEITIDGNNATLFNLFNNTTTGDGAQNVAYISTSSLGIKTNGIVLAKGYVWKDVALESLKIGEVNSRGSYVRFVINNQTITTLSDWRTYVSNNPITLVYELATATTETADPYVNPQIVDDFGTEEYVDYAYSQGTRDVAIPVGHYTEYMANLKAKLEMSPNSPEGAGDYIVRQTNGENEYVSLASNATIQDIIARLEALEGEGGE